MCAMDNADAKSLKSAAVCFQDLCILKEREDLRNILILDYGTFSRKQEHLDAVLSFNCLNKYFYVVIINETGHHSGSISFPPTFKQQNFSILEVPPSLLRNVGTIQDHVVTQMLMFLQQYCCRRAYYCLSLDNNFPDGSKIMEHIGREYTYCTVIKSVNDFIYLDKYHFRESDDPAKMTMFPLLRNDVPRVPFTENSGKLLFFCWGEKYFGIPVASLWEELEQFGNKYSLHVSVTTAFPSVAYEVIKEDPEITKPKFYRFAIYLSDTSEDKVLSVLEYLRPTKFVGTRIGLKLDSSTQKGQFVSTGSKNISRATYKICKYAIQMEHYSEDNKKYFVDIEGYSSLGIMENPIQPHLDSTGDFKDLCILKEREDLRNILILDYESLARSERQHNLTDILSCKCLKKYFHVIILCENGQESVDAMFPSCFNQQNCTVLKAPSKVLRNVHCISDHIVTRIMIFVEQYHCRRAFYCLSLDMNFPVGSIIMECTCREYTYCAILRSVEDLTYLDTYYFKESDDPTIMNVFPLLRNDVPRESYTEMSGKLMFFCRSENYFGSTIRSVWEELKQFGKKYSLHVSVTTAFPSVDYEVIRTSPEITKAKYYRLTIYLSDTSEDNVLSILEYLRSTKLEGGRAVLKLDSSTQEGRFGSKGIKKIPKAIYKICKYSIQREHLTEHNDRKYYTDIEDEQMMHLISEAKKGGYTMKVRHAKILFCGASGAGKTSFVRFLKNEKFRHQYHSTGLGNTKQVMIARKATIQGTKWIDLNPIEELHQLKLRFHHKLVFEPQPSCSEQPAVNTGGKDVIETGPSAVYQQVSHPGNEIPSQAQLKLLKSPSFKTGNFAKHTVTEKRLYSKSPNLAKDFDKPLPVWDILTLLDTGGQPQFINMLPAVNTSATVTFVVLNMLHVLRAKGFDERVLVHHYKNGIKSYEPYPWNYTNRDLIKCLVALLKDSIITDVPLPDVAVLQKGRDSKPGLCFVGTHLDQVNEKDVDTVSDQLEEIVSQLEPSDNVSIWNCDKILFAVDNTLAGEQEYSQDSIASKICSEVKRKLDEKAVYEVPIIWIILELEIRLMCNTQKKSFIAVSEVVALYQRIILECDKKNAEIQVRAALRFHHMFGILLYFHDVPGMNNFVISNPQWLFTNLTNFVCCSFDGTVVDYKDLANLKSKGILSQSLIEKINTDSLGGIDLQCFLELLEYLNIITPFPTNGSNDYLMLAVLDSYKDGECDVFKSMPPVDGVEFVIQFHSGTFPRGLFCCLIVCLVQKASSWKLQVSFEGKRCVYSNLVTFCTNSGQYVVLYDKISHLEIQVRKNTMDSECIHFEVQQTVVSALQHVNKQQNTVNLKCGFYCNTKPCVISLPLDHINMPIPRGLQCEYHGWMELKLHKLWYKPMHPKTSLTRNIKLQIRFPGQLKECPEEMVFTENYSKLTGVLNVHTLIPHFITKRVITVDDASDIKSCNRESEKIMKLLDYIARPLKAGYTESFYIILDVMKTHCTIAVEALAKDMESSLQAKGCEGDVTSRLSKSISLPTDESSGKGNSQSYNHSISEPAGRSSTD